MKTLQGKLTLFFGWKLTFENSTTGQIHEVVDENFRIIYSTIPATSWVGGDIKQTSENVSIECDLGEDDSIQRVYKATIVIDSADNFNFTLVEISHTEESLEVIYKK